MSPSVLDRVSSSFSQNQLSELQSQVDGLVTTFVDRATDGRSLAAMMVGGKAYEWARAGVLSAGVPGSQVLSVVAGLGTEVSAFEMTGRTLASLSEESSLNPNLWRWNGAGGIQQGLLASLITFGSLKGLGKIAQGQGILVQHMFQDSGMVLAQQVSGVLGIAPRPEGTLAEQFLRAEITNLQMGAGMALGHSLFQSTSQLPLILRGRETPFLRFKEVLSPALATAAPGGPSEPVPSSVLLMSDKNGEGRGGGYRPAADLASLARDAKKGQPEALETLGRFAKDNSEALRALADAAEKNMDALLFLIELSKGDHPAAWVKLKSLDLTRYADWRNPSQGKMGEGLLALAEMGNHEALDILSQDIIKYRDSPALALLESLAFRGHSGAILSIAEAALRNPRAVGSLSRLHSEGQPVKRILRDLPVGYYVTLAVAMEYKEMVPVLGELSLFGNREAFKGLSRAAHLHENAIRILEVLAYNKQPGAIAALADAARAMNKGMANLAITSLRTLAAWGFQEAAQALEAFPLPEEDPTSKPTGWFRRFLKMAAHYLSQVKSWP